MFPIRLLSEMVSSSHPSKSLGTGNPNCNELYTLRVLYTQYKKGNRTGPHQDMLRRTARRKRSKDGMPSADATTAKARAVVLRTYLSMKRMSHRTGEQCYTFSTPKLRQNPEPDGPKIIRVSQNGWSNSSDPLQQNMMSGVGVHHFQQNNHLSPGSPFLRALIRMVNVWSHCWDHRRKTWKPSRLIYQPLMFPKSGTKWCL